MFKVEMAGITVAIDNKYEYIKALSEEHMTEGDADITLSAAPSEIELQMKNLGVSADYAESVVIYTSLAEMLFRYDAFLMHAVALEYRGEVYLISAKSGVGKTTHASLWKRAFGNDVRVLNGDKPLIRKIDGKFYASGTMWRGKEREGGVGTLPIRAIYYLERGTENEAATLGAAESAKSLIKHIYMPKRPEAILKTLSLAGELSEAALAVKLAVNTDISAARVALDFVENAKYEN